MADRNLRLKILNLGFSGSGKTMYISAFNHFLSKGTLDGVSVAMTDSAKLKNLLTIWSNLVTSGEWDSVTTKLTTYPFDVYFHGAKFMELEWVDFRGEDIISFNDAEKKDLEDALGNVDAVFISIPGDAIQTFLLDNDAARFEERVKPGMITNLYTKHFLQKKSRVDRWGNKIRIPVVFILTMADIFEFDFAENKISNKKYENLIEMVKHLFPLFFVRGSSFYSMICPVSLGNLRTDFQGGFLVSPKNISIPWEFFLKTQFTQYVVEASNLVRGDTEGVWSTISLDLFEEFLERIEKNFGCCYIFDCLS